MRSLVSISLACLLVLLTSHCINAQPITWQRVYETPVSDIGVDGISDYDGGYVVLYKLSEQFGGTRILKLDAFGNQLSSTIADSTSIGTCIIQTRDSGFVISGFNNFGRLIKVDKFFNVMWARSYSINNQQALLKKVIELPDGDFLACGYTSLFPLNAYLMKTDSSGALKWQYQYTLSSSFTDPYDICYSQDSFIYFTGAVSDNGITKTLICKLDNAGKSLWHRTYGTSGEGDTQAGLCIRSDNSQTLYLSGQRTIHYSYKGHFTKIDSSGNVIFQKLYNSVSEYWSIVRAVGGFFLCGNDGNLGRISLLKIDEDGEEIYNKLFGFGSVDDFTYVSSFRNVKDREMLITGQTSFPTGSDMNTNVAVFKTDSSGSITSIAHGIDANLIKNFDLYQNYPNPFNPKTTIPFSTYSSGSAKLTIIDTRGKIIDVLFDKFVLPGNHKVEFNASKLSSGIYLYKLNFDGSNRTRKFVLIK